jgi:hypothetical protein
LVNNSISKSSASITRRGRVDPGPKRRRQHHPLQQRLSTGTEQIAHQDLHPTRRRHRVHLALQARSQRHQLGSVAHQLPQLTSGRWSDPRLGQSTHPQQIRQIRSVTLIFSELKTILKLWGRGW